MPRQDDKFAQSPVRVYDAYGRERLIDRKVWRDQILPQNIRNNWHNAEILYTLLAEALGDGYEADIVKAAEHLHKLEKKSARSTCLYGVVLTRVGKIRDAERVMHTYLFGANGEGNGCAYSILQKHILRETKKLRRARRFGERSRLILMLITRCNGTAQSSEKECGPAALTQTWQRIAALPNSWRVRLFLAREALEGGKAARCAWILQRSAERRGRSPPRGCPYVDNRRSRKPWAPTGSTSDRNRALYS